MQACSKPNKSLQDGAHTEAAMAENAAATATAPPPKGATAEKKNAGEDLVDQLMAMNIESKTDVWCKFTRKCKTKMCPCFSSGITCSVKCHPRNNSCTNSA